MIPGIYASTAYAPPIMPMSYPPANLPSVPYTPWPQVPIYGQQPFFPTQPLPAPTVPMAPKTFTTARAKHILVKTREEAELYRRQILSGRPFEDVARAVSKCPSGRKGGDLGTFHKGDMVPEFDKAVAALPIGVVSPPVKTDFGYHLIKVIEKH